MKVIFPFSFPFRCREPTKTLPAKATLPSVLSSDASSTGGGGGGSGGKSSRDGSRRSKRSSNESAPVSAPVSAFSSRRSRKISRDSFPKSGSLPLTPQPPERPSLVVSDVSSEAPESNIRVFPTLAPMEDDIDREFPDVEIGLITSPYPRTPSTNPSTPAVPSPTTNENKTFGNGGLQVPKTASKSGGLKSALSPLLKRKHPPKTATDDDEDDRPSPPLPPKTNTVEFKLVEDLRLVTIPVTSCLFVLVFYILVGTILFSAWEGWDYLDGAYFCFTSLMTIGFGDFVPGNDYIYQVDDSVDKIEARAKLIIGTVYILLGMALVAMCFNLMQEKIVQQIRTLARRIGLIRPIRSLD